MYTKSLEFFLAFNNIFSKHKEEAINCYASNKAFTEFVIQKINIALQNMGYETQKEYFRIDAIDWKPRADELDDTHGIRLYRHLWDLGIAVEHENNSHDWMDEVVKLAHIACPLRVVIGYMPYNKRNEDQLHLDFVSDALQKLSCFDNMNRGEFLIILGNCDTAGKEDCFFNYKGYVYNGETSQFEAITMQ